ncbi:transposase [Caldovatus sediminis]|uniref:Transposase n=1 Tax=Caldovatus sediminis TaxID=2041189 RepID=A0A8J3EBY3_9PROT|nr:AAA family ATPase [Caldovatus sediminis]GGG30790.1 transposase [Caldovatus sediminis]
MPVDTAEAAAERAEAGAPAADAQEAVRAEIRAVMAAERLAMTEIARQAGIAYGSLTAWMGGHYQGRGERIAEQARRWLASRQAQARTRALLPAAPGFVATPTAEAIFATFEHAQHLPELVVVTGAPGVGKTAACRAYQTRAPNVWILTAEPVHATPRALLDDLAEAVGIADRGLSSQRLSRAIAQRLRGSGGLVVVDEAQHLPSVALDQLRMIHDLAEVGVALVGNETVYARLEGGARAAHYAQLFSRVGMRLARPRPQRGDIEALLDAWGVAGKGERGLLQVIARKPGALRNLTKVLRVAHMLAGGEGAAAVAEAHIRMAWERLSGAPVGGQPAAEAAA